MACERVERVRRSPGKYVSLAVLATSPLAFAWHAARPVQAPIAPEGRREAVAAARSRIQGQVVDRDGAALSEVDVLVTYPTLGARRERVPTDSMGRFSFRPRSVDFVLNVTHPSEGALTTEVLRADAPAPAFEPFVLVLARRPRISGHVVDRHGAPIANAELRLAPEHLEEARASSSWMSTDERGAFTTTAPATGLYTLSARARGFAPSEVAVALRDDELGLELVLYPEASPRGVVRDPDGRSVRGAIIVACPGDDEVRLESAEDGSFELGSSAVGCAAIAHHPSFAHSRAVRLGSRRPNELRLERGGTIEGIVTNVSGHTLSNARLEIESFTASEDEGPLEGVTIERSISVHREFRLEDLAPGTYVLTVASEATDSDGWVTTATAEKSLEVTSGAVVRGVHIVVRSPSP